MAALYHPAKAGVNENDCAAPRLTFFLGVVNYCLPSCRITEANDKLKFVGPSRLLSTNEINGAGKLRGGVLPSRADMPSGYESPGLWWPTS